MGSSQKGCIIAKNEFGTLERVDGTNTCIGSTTLPDGKVVTKRFRGKITDQEKTIESWEKWQGREGNLSEEPPADIPAKKPELETKAPPSGNKVAICPFSKEACGPMCPMYSPTHLACSIFLGGVGLYNLSVNAAKYDAAESLELIAMAITDLKASDIPGASFSESKGDRKLVDWFLEKKSFMAFVNLTSKKVHGNFISFCHEKGLDIVPIDEKELTSAILRKYPELDKKTYRGGTTFVPKE